MKQVPSTIDLLIIEPDPEERSFLRHLLKDDRDFACHISTASQFKEAENDIHEGKYACLIISSRESGALSRNGIKMNSGKIFPVLLLTDGSMPPGEFFPEALVFRMRKEQISRRVLRKAIQTLIKETLPEAVHLSEEGGVVRVLINSVPNPVFMLDSEGRHVFFNRAYEHFWGMSHDDIRGRTFDEISSGVHCTFAQLTSRDPAPISPHHIVEVERVDSLGRMRFYFIHFITLQDAIFIEAQYIGFYIDVTERVSSENQLRKLIRIVEQSPASVVITDTKGTIEYINPRFSQMTGYSFDEAVGKNPSILKSGAQSPDFYRELWDTINSGQEWKGEFQNRKKNGEVYWELASISPMKDRKGQITHFIAVKEDISYLKKIEKDLNASKENLTILFETIPEGLAVTDLEGVISQVNRSFQEMFEIPYRESIAGRRITEFIREEFFLKMQSFPETGDSQPPLYFEQNATLPSGRELTIEFNSTLLRHREAGPDALVFLIKDITERKNSEKSIRDSEQRTRALIEAVPDLMFRVNNDGVYLDKMLGSKIFEVFPESIAKEGIHYIDKALKTNEIQIFEYPVTINGIPYYYEARFIISGEDEVLVILRNVTERKNAEDQLIKARAEAEEANKAKSEFLANMSHEIRTPLNSILGFIELTRRTELNPSQREYLDIVSRSAENLLGIINDILDYSKIESRKLEIDTVKFNPLREFESTIALFNTKASEKDIVLLSFIDPHLPVSVTGDPLRIKQVLSNLMSNAIKFTPQKGTVLVEIRHEAEDDGKCRISFSVRDTGIGIPDRKRQLIFEAFAQADSSVTRKYGGTGLGLSISANLVSLMGGSLELESQQGKGSRFFFTLELACQRDSQNLLSFPPSLANIRTAIYAPEKGNVLQGIVIADYLGSFGIVYRPLITRAEIREARDLQLLFAVYDEETREFLSAFIRSQHDYPIILISREKFRDELSVESHRGVFIIFEPLNPSKVFDVIQEVLLPNQARMSRERPENRETNIFHAMALVAEDNAVNQKLITLMLREFGVTAHIAGNGLDAYEMYTETRYDIVFMDINMPVSDGIETTAMILEYERQSGKGHTPIVALTAKAMKGDRESLLAQGLDDYLSKPIDIVSLENVLQKYLKDLRPPAASPGIREEALHLPDLPLTEDIPPYDLKASAAELGIPPQVLRSILQEFFDSSEEFLKELLNAIESHNLENLRQTAHRIKGAASNLRLEAISRNALFLEKNAGEGKSLDYSREYNILKEIIHHYEMAFKE